MAVEIARSIGTENFRFSNLVKKELWADLAYCREVVTFNGSAGDLVIGTVLGQVTATGKYKVAVETAVDGSEDAAAILLEDITVAATTDTQVLVLVRGPAIVGKAALVLGASFDNATKKNLAYSQLEAKGILVSPQV